MFASGGRGVPPLSNMLPTKVSYWSCVVSTVLYCVLYSYSGVVRAARGPVRVRAILIKDSTKPLVGVHARVHTVLLLRRPLTG